MMACNVYWWISSFRMEVYLEVASDSTSAMLIGKPADVLLGVSFEKLVIEEGHTEQSSPPEQISRSRGLSRHPTITAKDASKRDHHVSHLQKELCNHLKTQTQKKLFQSEPRKKNRKRSKDSNSEETLQIRTPQKNRKR